MTKTKILAILVLAATIPSCMPFLGTVKPNVAAGNEIVFTNELNTLLQIVPKPKIVIRVSNPPNNVTEAEKFNAYINQIEKVFVQNGFTVRDRALLQNLMASGNADYQAIKNKIDTDLIIDILSLQFDIPHHVSDFFNKTTQKADHFASPENYIDCSMAKLECRLTIVDKGQLGGLLTIYTSRCDMENLEFIVDAGHSRMGWTQNNTGPTFAALSASFENEEVKRAYTEYLTRALINLITGQLQKVLQKAIDAYSLHQYPQALEILNGLIEKDPQNWVYYTYTGLIAARQNDFAKAQQELDKALLYASFPEARTTVYYCWANYYSLKQEKEGALSFFKKALDGGYKDFKHIEESENLVFLRGLPEYPELIKAAQAKAAEPGKK